VVRGNGWFFRPGARAFKQAKASGRLKGTEPKIGKNFFMKNLTSGQSLLLAYY